MCLSLPFLYLGGSTGGSRIGCRGGALGCTLRRQGDPLRIGFYVSHIGVPENFRNNVSGHIQLPLRSAELLHDAGHDVHVITNRIGPGLAYPEVLPESVVVHEVVDSRRRSVHGQFARKGVNPLRFVQQVVSISAICRKLDLQILHVWGFARTVDMGALLAIINPSTRVVGTLFSAPDQPLSTIRAAAWHRLARYILSAEFTAAYCHRNGLTSVHIPHPAVRDLGHSRATGSRNSVLFWREMTHLNGADVAAEAFARLATAHPATGFVFAVRAWAAEVSGVEVLMHDHPNIIMHRFPYQEGVTIEGLLAQAICVVMPFRRLTIDPQLSVLESLQAGVPVVASDIRSNPEYVRPGQTGALVRVGDVDGVVAAVAAYLDNPAEAERQGKEARRSVELDWDVHTARLLEEYANIVGSGSSTGPRSPFPLQDDGIANLAQDAPRPSAAAPEPPRWT